MINFRRMAFPADISENPPENVWMKSFGHEIAALLTKKGIKVKEYYFPPAPLLECSGPGGHGTLILPIEIICRDERQAVLQSKAISALKAGCIRHFKEQGTDCPGIISVPEDRWERQKDLIVRRLLAHCGTFVQVYARNCEVIRIDKPEAQAFMEANHSYGPASCRYCYGLFIKRQSGENIKKYPPGTLVAAAEFSNARKWVKSGKEIRSYEWIRYASLPGLRVTGGMGKILRRFIDEVHPDDIMSYADSEWSCGEVYTKLGFKKDGIKAPVMFRINPATWERKPVKDVPVQNAFSCMNQETTCTEASEHKTSDQKTGTIYYMNSGSIKYRLKLTQWENGTDGAIVRQPGFGTIKDN